LILYAESSAVLAWLLGEPLGPTVRDALADAEAVTASDLTLVECDRALIRGVTTGEVTVAEAGRGRRMLNQAAAHWNLLRIEADVVDRARRPFPAEPLRTLDAIHVATAEIVAASVNDFAVLALDGRIRRAARGLGLSVVPA
jgi:predicted nucleic acid-binding protein